MAQRTALNSNHQVIWCRDDKFALYEVSGTHKAEFSLSSGDGTGEGTFTSATSEALPFSSTYRAYYPANLPVSNDEYEWPTVQEHSANQCANAPMVSRSVHVNYDHKLTDLHFINLGGLLQITLSGSETVSSIVFHGKRADRGEETMITLTNCDKAPAPYYIAVEPGEYSSVRLAFIKSDNKTVAVKKLPADYTLSIERNKILPMALPALNFQTVPDAVPITWKGQTVYFATKNYGASTQTDLGTMVSGNALPTQPNWHVPTAQEMEILFHWSKSIDAANWGVTPNPDYTWSWQPPCAVVKETKQDDPLSLFLPAAQDQDGTTYSAYYWSSTGVTTSAGECRYMYNVSYKDQNQQIVTAVGTGLLNKQAYVRLVYDL